MVHRISQKFNISFLTASSARWDDRFQNTSHSNVFENQASTYHRVVSTVPRSLRHQRATVRRWPLACSNSGVHWSAFIRSNDRLSLSVPRFLAIRTKSSLMSMHVLLPGPRPVSRWAVTTPKLRSVLCHSFAHSAAREFQSSTAVNVLP